MLTHTDLNWKKYTATKKIGSADDKTRFWSEISLKKTEYLYKATTPFLSLVLWRKKTRRHFDNIFASVSLLSRW